MGDPAGIGPEIIAKALKNLRLPKNITPVIIGDQAIYKRYAHRIPENFMNLGGVSAGAFRVGSSNAKCARASLNYLSAAFNLLRQGKISALVTAPVCKEAICSLGAHFQGHTEYIANFFAIKNYEMMFVGKNFKCVIATRHIPLSKVSKEIIPQKLYQTILLTASSLKHLFKIQKPRLAICGINPHAGENGTIGNEEIKTIIPVIKKLQKNGFNVAGPFAADTLFYPKNSQRYDCVVAMYHDQGLAPMKALCLPDLVNITIGLPFIRTSPAHGTAFDIAGQNRADPASMMAAIKLAGKLCS